MASRPPTRFHKSDLNVDHALLNAKRVSYDADKGKFVGLSKPKWQIFGRVESPNGWSEEADSLYTLTQLKQLLNDAQAETDYEGIADLAADREIEQLLIYGEPPRSKKARARNAKPEVVGAKPVTGRVHEHLKNRLRNYSNMLDHVKARLQQNPEYAHIPPAVLNDVVNSINLRQLAQFANITPPDLTAKMPEQQKKELEAAHQRALHAAAIQAATNMADAISQAYNARAGRPEDHVNRPDARFREYKSRHYLSDMALSEVDFVALTKKLNQARPNGGSGLQDAQFVNASVAAVFEENYDKHAKKLKAENFEMIRDYVGVGAAGNVDRVGSVLADKLRENGARLALSSVGAEQHLSGVKQASDNYRPCTDLNQKTMRSMGFDRANVTVENYQPPHGPLRAWEERPLTKSDFKTVADEVAKSLEPVVERWQAQNKEFAKHYPTMNAYIDRRAKAIYDTSKQISELDPVLDGDGAGARSAEYDPTKDPSPRDEHLLGALVYMEVGGRMKNGGHAVSAVFNDLKEAAATCAKLEENLESLPDLDWEEFDTKTLKSYQREVRKWHKEATANTAKISRAHQSGPGLEILESPKKTEIGRLMGQHYMDAYTRNADVLDEIEAVEAKIDQRIQYNKTQSQVTSLTALRQKHQSEFDTCRAGLDKLAKEPIESMDIKTATTTNKRIRDYLVRLLKARKQLSRFDKAVANSAKTEAKFASLKLGDSNQKELDVQKDAFIAKAKEANKRVLDRIKQEQQREYEEYIENDKLHRLMEKISGAYGAEPMRAWTTPKTLASVALAVADRCEHIEELERLEKEGKLKGYELVKVLNVQRKEVEDFFFVLNRVHQACTDAVDLAAHYMEKRLASKPSKEVVKAKGEADGEADSGRPEGVEEVEIADSENAAIKQEEGVVAERASNALPDEWSQRMAELAETLHAPAKTPAEKAKKAEAQQLLDEQTFHSIPKEWKQPVYDAIDKTKHIFQGDSEGDKKALELLNNRRMQFRDLFEITNLYRDKVAELSRVYDLKQETARAKNRMQIVKDYFPNIGASEQFWGDQLPAVLKLKQKRYELTGISEIRMHLQNRTEAIDESMYAKRSQILKKKYAGSLVDVKSTLQEAGGFLGTAALLRHNLEHKPRHDEIEYQKVTPEKIRQTLTDLETSIGALKDLPAPKKGDNNLYANLRGNLLKDLEVAKQALEVHLDAMTE